MTEINKLSCVDDVGPVVESVRLYVCGDPNRMSERMGRSRGHKQLLLGRKGGGDRQWIGAMLCIF